MEGRFAIGLDLGGTDLKSALISPAGAVSEFARRPSRTQESREAVFGAIEAAVAELRSRAPDVVAVGLGCPGPIDPLSGARVGATAHLPHWSDLPVRDELARRLGLPVAVDNDANLAALAEHRLGAARGSRVSITVTLGTGIGCGIVIDGRVFQGSRGGAGELGHVPLGRGGAGACPCGVPDCVEPEASAAALRSDGREPPEVFRRARSGDAEARRRILALCDRLGAAVATAIQILDPEVVVIGGGLSEAGEALLDPLRAAVRRYALPSHQGSRKVVMAGLGERAGTIGAGLLAWDAASGGTERR